MKYAAFLLILSAAIGCGDSSTVPSDELTPDGAAEIEANDQAVEEAESALKQSKRQ